MTIKQDCLKHKMLIQKYGIKESNTFIKDLRKTLIPLVKIGFRKETAQVELIKIVESQYNRFIEFANYEAKWNAKLYSKYTKQSHKPILITWDIILKLKFPLSLHTDAVSLKESFDSFVNSKLKYMFQLRSDAQVANKDPLVILEEAINGLFSSQARVLITSAINCIAMNARVLK